jgi:sec-independent protein translocase protein TatC
MEIWKFISPALTIKERKGASGFVFITNFLFLVGVSFGYFIISPLSVSFLAQYSLSDQIQNSITLDSYLSMVLLMALGSGIVFELPVFIYFLAKMGIVTKKLLKEYRKHASVILIIVAAVITPSPDAFSMLMVSLPLLMLYEVGIIVAGRVEKKKIEDL